MNPLATLLAADPKTTRLLVTLFVIFAAAKVLAELFERLRMPGVVGEILAGIVIGPGVLNWVQPDEFVGALAELGVIFLLFTVGLETQLAAVLQVGRTALLVAVGGVVLPFAAGWGIMTAWGRSGVEAVFVGAALVATSVGITARVLGAMGLMEATASRVIIAAAVIDDILGLLVLAVVSALAKGSLNWVELGTTAALAVGFTAFVAVVGTRAMRRVGPRLRGLRVAQAEFAFAVVLAFGLSLLATKAGVAAIIGAFLAGMVLSEHLEGSEVHHLARGVTEFVTPFFLVSIGLHFRASTEVLVPAAVITLAAVATKLVGCGLGAWSLGWRDALRVGVGMAPRGEVGMVVAQIGLGLGAVSDATYAVVVLMAVATTLIAPPFLRRLFAGQSRGG